MTETDNSSSSIDDHFKKQSDNMSSKDGKWSLSSLEQGHESDDDDGEEWAKVRITVIKASLADDNKSGTIDCSWLCTSWK